MLLRNDLVLEALYEYWNFDGAASDDNGAFVVMPGGLVIEDSPWAGTYP